MNLSVSLFLIILNITLLESKLSAKDINRLVSLLKSKLFSAKSSAQSIYCDPDTKIRARDCIKISLNEGPEELFCSDFTQNVCKPSKLEIGSDKSKSRHYVVAKYNQPESYIGQFPKNVIPPGDIKFRYTTSEEETDNDISPPFSNSINTKYLGNYGSKFRFKSASISGNQFEEDCLRAHNYYRSKHGVPPLKLNKNLCKYAEEWANVLVKKGRMEHRDQNQYGENIYYIWSSDPSFVVSGKEPVDKWYSEIKDHIFGQEPTSLATGHFTQVVWEDTKEVGVGIAKSRDGRIYVVANYYPPGNVIGSFARKVHPPIY